MSTKKEGLGPLMLCTGLSSHQLHLYMLLYMTA